jgi:hypothetical protein
MEIIRHLPERFQDDRKLLTSIRTSPPRERYRPSDRLATGHRLRTPDCCAFVGVFDCLTGRWAAIDTHERQRNEIDHHRPPTLDA